MSTPKLQRLRSLPLESLLDYITALEKELETTADEEHKQRIRHDILIALFIQAIRFGEVSNV